MKRVGSDDDIQTDDIQTDDIKGTSSYDAEQTNIEKLAKKIGIPDDAIDLFVKIAYDIYWDDTFEEINDLKKSFAESIERMIKKNHSGASVALRALTGLGVISSEDYYEYYRRMTNIDDRLTWKDTFDTYIQTGKIPH